MKGGHIQLKQGKPLLCQKGEQGEMKTIDESMRIFFCCIFPPGADYGQISEETWQYLLGIYGGGPEIAIRQTVAPADPDSLHGERKIEAETRAL